MAAAGAGGRLEVVGSGAVRLEPLALFGLLLLAAGVAEPDHDGHTAAASTDGHGATASAPASAPTSSAAGAATAAAATSTSTSAPASARAVAA